MRWAICSEGVRIMLAPISTEATSRICCSLYRSLPVTVTVSTWKKTVQAPTTDTAMRSVARSAKNRPFRRLL